MGLEKKEEEESQTRRLNLLQAKLCCSVATGPGVGASLQKQPGATSRPLPGPTPMFSEVTLPGPLSFLRGASATGPQGHEGNR